jgi:putative pyruvate formate lyase activating enzyme
MGAPHSLDTLFKKIQDLIAKGVHNLNFVTPDHFWPHLRKLCHRLKECGESLPIIFNTSGYQSAKMITAHSQCADIFLSDFKFAHPELAEMCMGDRRYPEIAIAGLTQMVAEKGFLQPWDPSGQTTAREGVLVRHLVMPGHIENSLDTLRILRREFGRLLPLSVMSQYQPMPATRGIDGFNRSLTPSEYNHVRKLVTELEFEHVYIQELNDNTCFLPDFTQEKPFNGNS